MHASNHEKLIHHFSQYSFGSNYLFTPEEWNKGTAKREPADMVWACNNSIILFYAQKSSRPAHTDPQVNTNRRAKSIDHNLTQAKGWLREWKSGRDLIGENTISKFKISYGQYKYIVVISVVDILGCDQVDEASEHSDFAHKYELAGCFTIPLTAIEYAAINNFSMLDFLTVLHIWRKESKRLQKGLLGIMKDYYKGCLLIADPNQALNSNDKIRMYKNFINHVRSGIPTVPGSPIAQSDEVNIFNDLSLGNHIQILVAHQELSQYLRADMRLCAVIYVKCQNYLFIIGNSHSNNAKQTLDSMIKIQKEEEHKFSSVVFIIMFAELDQPLMIATTKLAGVSNTEKLLATWSG